MMEKSDVSEAHHHVVTVAGFNDIVVTDRTARLSYISYTRSMSSLNVVAKRKEGIGTK